MKAEFLTDLTVKLLDDDTAKLVAPLVYRSKVLKQEIEVPGGFVTDFASVPRLPLAYLLAGGVAKEAAVVHDYLYQVHKVSKFRADRVFLEAMKVTGVTFWRRQLMYRAVQGFGWIAYSSGPDRFKKLGNA